MKACILAIGDELISGFTVDTNSSWISNYLFNYGINISKQIVVGDDSREIIDELQRLVDDKFKLIFITGGLGPTHDDITKKTLSEFFKSDIVIDAEHSIQLKRKITKKGLNYNSLHKSQSYILKCSSKIENLSGTALGMHVDYFDSDIFVIPGVPEEMKNMMNSQIIKILSNKYNLHKNEFITIRTTGIYESKLYDLLKKMIDNHLDQFKVSFLPHYYGVDIRISSIRIKNTKLFNIFKDKVILKVEKYIYGFNSETMAEVLFKLLKKKKLTLSTAESCTGGLISKSITEFPGSSDVFLGGVVSYSNFFKEKILKVEKNNLNNYGAVSESVSKDMCSNIKKMTNSDTSISITGISGPDGGTEDKPVGTVYITVNFKEKFKTKKFILYPDRKIHRIVSSTTGMNMLRLLILENLK